MLNSTARRVATCRPGKPGLTSFSETLALFFIQFLSFRKMQVWIRAYQKKLAGYAPDCSLTMLTAEQFSVSLIIYRNISLSRGMFLNWHALFLPFCALTKKVFNNTSTTTTTILFFLMWYSWIHARRCLSQPLYRCSLAVFFVFVLIEQWNKNPVVLQDYPAETGGTSHLIMGSTEDDSAQSVSGWLLSWTVRPRKCSIVEFSIKMYMSETENA